jgi:hypothetical protein
MKPPIVIDNFSESDVANSDRDERPTISHQRVQFSHGKAAAVAGARVGVPIVVTVTTASDQRVPLVQHA